MDEILSLAEDSLGEIMVARLRADFYDRCGTSTSSSSATSTAEGDGSKGSGGPLTNLLQPNELGLLLRSHGFCPTESELNEVIRAANNETIANNRIQGKSAANLTEGTTLNVGVSTINSAGVSISGGISLSKVLNLAIQLKARSEQRLNMLELRKALKNYEIDKKGIKIDKGINKLKTSAAADPTSEPEIPVSAFRNVMLNAGDRFTNHELEVLLEEMKDRGIYDVKKGTIMYEAMIDVMVEEVKKGGMT